MSAVPLRAAAPETPFFFDSHGLPLYAVFHDAVPGRPGAPVLVHVHSLGVEHVTLYRQDTLTARQAAALGVPALRFHARGHGDSAGSSADVTLGTLVEDARAAADEAKRRSGRARVLWLGMRFGGLVAALAGRGRDDTAGYLLWEPTQRPPEFFRQQMRTLLYSQVAGGKKPDATVDQMFERIAREGRVDVFGYELERTLVESAREASLADALADQAAPVRIAQLQQRSRLAAPHQQLADALAQRGVDVRTACVHDEPGTQMLTNPAWQSAELSRVTGEWLDALA